jgi:acyl-coenzyme A thioesterase PaaI-like protein
VIAAPDPVNNTQRGNIVKASREVAHVIATIGGARGWRHTTVVDHEWIEEPDDGFIDYVGPVFNRPFAGGVGRFRFLAEKRHRNRAGYVQGGMLMTFADRALGMTARQHDLSRNHATVQLNMHFVAPVAIGRAVEIVCTIVKSTRTLVFVQGNLFVDDEVVATAHGIFKILATRTPPPDGM